MRLSISLFLLLRSVEVLAENPTKTNEIPPLQPNFENIETNALPPKSSRFSRSPSDQTTTTPIPRTPIYIPDVRPEFQDHTNVEEGSGMNPSTSTRALSPLISMQFPEVTPTPSFDTYINGYLSNRQYRSLTPTLMGDELMAVNRPGGPNEFVAFWIPQNGRPVWGKVFVDSTGKTAGSFILNGRVYNTSDPSIFSQTRVLTYAPDYEEKFNFRYSWVPMGRLDPNLAVTVINDARQCKQTVPALLVDRIHKNFQYLGEVDLITRQFNYVYGGIPHTIADSSQFMTDVRVIVKLRCQCSCGI
ncbi:unnamed protein product, partial [Mesorhabditis belari]|uniref:Uncharacterized protein n=1 Tax=Mesorhabditis belari TaxID=2138241 RepID=A0AAF3EGE5_9BILA